MIRTRERSGGRARSLASGAALGTAAALVLGGLVATPALAAPGGSSTGTGTNHATLSPTLTVAPGQELNPTGDTVLTLQGQGYSKTNDWGQSFGGAYLLFGVITPKTAGDTGSWAPSKQGLSGVNYDYAAGAGTYQSLINYPGNTTEPGLGYMDASGNWTSELTIPGATFTSQAGQQIDCLAAGTQCGVITIGAHGQVSSGVEVFTPVTFATENWEAVAPSITGQPVDAQVTEGQDAVFTVTVEGDPAPTIQWQSRANADEAFADVAGAVDPSFTVSAAALSDSGRQVQAVVQNEAGSVTSSVATLTVTESAPEPHGTSQGAPLSGTDSYLVVTPAEDLRTGSSTEVTVEGFGFDPGPAVAPGTGSGGIYVGFGTMKDPSDPEKWRRSAGGTSGPVGMGDYTYGAPIFVANQGTADGDVASGEMDSEGHWTTTVTIPSKDVPSFFGDTIDCLANQCGFFSFGAHGAVKAQNEAFTPVYFAGQDAPAVPATATSTSLAPQTSADFPTDFAGQDVALSATVTPAEAAGSVEFFDGETSLGAADVAAGAATLTTDAFVGGARQVTAVFTPTNPAAFEASTSAAQTFRIVDLARAIGDIEVGTPVAQIEDASFGWSIANYYSSFGYEFGKEAVSGNVTVPEAVVGDKEFNSNRLFTFTDGTGTRDADGNAVIDFSGVARVTSGSASEWNFADPQLHVNAAGDGYVTAEFSGFFRIEGLAEVDYAPQRVTVATFSGANAETEDGQTAFTVSPIWEGQTAAGTWAGEYTGSFPNEFTSLLYSGIRSFFTQTGTTGSNLTKPVQPISVQFAEQAIAAPSLSIDPDEALDRAGADIAVTGESFDTSGKPTYPGAPDTPAGVYVSLGWISNDGWKPSEGAAAATRVAVETKWVQEAQETGGQYIKWTKLANGRADFGFTFEDVTYAEVLAKKPTTGDYRLAVYSIGASGVRQAANEFAQDVTFAPAAATQVWVDAQASTAYPVDFAGEDVTVSATTSPADAAGAIEFFDGETSLGTSTVEDGSASLTTDVLSGGAHQISAVFTPADEVQFEGSTSAAQTYRIVDLTPLVSGIEVGAEVKAITGAELTWSVANYLSFGSGPAKSVLAGDVTLDAGSFHFANGTGSEDAAGNRVISFDGEVRLTSGTIPEWNFRAPQVHVNAAGDGYITAIVDGIYRGSILGGEDETYGPTRVTVSTFTGSTADVTDGVTSFTVAPTFQGQVAAGTWGGAFTGATFANEFLQHINAGVRSFFLQSGSSSDATKAGSPITVAYTAGVAPSITGQPADAAVVEGSGATFSATVTGDPAPQLQWQSRATASGEWADVDGATASELVLSDVALAANGTQVRLVATNAFGTVESAPATLTVSPKKPETTPVVPELTSDNQGSVEVVAVDGRTVVANVGEEFGNTWIGVTLHSDPQFLGWFLASANGDVTVTVPAGVTGAHRLSYVDAAGDLIGWANVSFAADPVIPGEEPVDGSGGTGTGGAGTSGGQGQATTAGLSQTGAMAPVAVTGIALLLLVAGASILVVKRRRSGLEAE